MSVSRAVSPPARSLLNSFKFALAGGSVDVSGSVENAAGGGHVAMVATLAGIDAAQLAGLAGREAGQIAGRLDGGLTLDMTGDTVKSALKVGRGHIVFAVTEADVARDLIERISTDLRTLFRTQEDMVQLTCLLGIVDLRNGIGTIWPLRLRTVRRDHRRPGAGGFSGSASRPHIQSVAASTSFFALDVPVEISGEFRDLHVLPGADAAEAPDGNRPAARPAATLAAPGGAKRLPARSGVTWRSNESAITRTRCADWNRGRRATLSILISKMALARLKFVWRSGHR